jgi:hypothetical protein
MFQILLAANIACSSISFFEAKQLVLLTPNAIESHAKLGADLAARFSQLDGKQWVFQVYATNSPPPGSDLVGWYEVDPQTYVVRDWILDGKPIQVSPQLQAFQNHLQKEHCSK